MRTVILSTFILLACQQKDQFIEKPTRADLRSGSIHYASANCAGCHGIDFDGKGSEASKLQSQGLAATNFTTDPSPDATPVRYFKAMTQGTALMKSHTFHQLTDKARWQMAHFLFGQHKPLSGEARDKQVEALSKDFSEAREAYTKTADRRWILGFNLPAEREKAPDPSILKEAIDLQVAPAVTATRATRELYDSSGARLYQANCAGCHGLRGEGQNIRTGFVTCREPGNRLCGKFITTSGLDLTRDFHGETGWLPDFSSLVQEDLDQIRDYINSTGQR
ncbi:MAG: c-type cytochrome [Spirochaetales bacterium]|nr:c-type cytochrome [Spirochaetales bacterium]